MNRQECEEMVSGPGKFEGEAPYVPFYWNVFLDGFADRIDGDLTWFDVKPEDRETFPELRSRGVVCLVERDDGFVVEV